MNLDDVNNSDTVGFPQVPNESNPGEEPPTNDPLPGPPPLLALERLLNASAAGRKLLRKRVVGLDCGNRKKLVEIICLEMKGASSNKM